MFLHADSKIDQTGKERTKERKTITTYLGVFFKPLLQIKQMSVIY